jgi:acyl dehydratase
MALDPEKLLNAPPIVTRQVLTRKDTILYALGVGASELDFVFEERLKALPTMAVVLGYPGFFWRDPAYGVNWQKLLHGEQWLELHGPMPVEGEIIGETRIEAIVDKGAEKGAIAWSSRRITDAGGRPIATVRGASFLRGDGGFGGSPKGGPEANPAPPERPGDQSVTIETARNQALIYRLSGDLNPLHIDPAVAAKGGFQAPILHGLCTYGVVGRAILASTCGNDPARLKRMDVRFSSPVYPGETIVTEIWSLGHGRHAFRASVKERGVVVINNGVAVVG